MRLAVDLESNGFLDEATKVWCGVCKDIDTNRTYLFGPEQIGELLRTLSMADELIIHNGIKFDLPLLRKLYGWSYNGRVVDTLLMSRLQRPNRKLPPNCPSRTVGPHSIEAWGYRVGIPKPSHDEWDVYSEAMLNRCLEDVHILHKVYDALLAEGDGEEWGNSHRIVARLFTLLQRQEERGFTVDQDHLRRSLSTLNRWKELIKKAVEPQLPLVCVKGEHKIAGEWSYVKKPFLKTGQLSRQASSSFASQPHQVGGPYSRVEFRHVSLDKPTELKTLLLSLGWEPIQWNFDGTGNRTSPKLSKDDPFIGIEGKLGKLICKYVQCKQRESVLSGWALQIRPDGRLPGVVTGLAVTSRAKHSVIVNVPRSTSFFGKWMRKIFIPQEGWTLVGCDAVSCQIRMLAARMGDEKWKELILREKPHKMHAEIAGLPNTDMAKSFFYALIFGTGDEKAGRLWGRYSSKVKDGSPKGGRALKTLFLEELPALKALQESLVDEWRKTAIRKTNPWGRVEYRDGWLKGLDGRLIQIDSEHKVLVGMLQSDEAILMQVAYNIFHRRMDNKGYKWGEDYATLLWMHDEFQVECRPEIAQEVGETMAEAIRWTGEYLKIDCPQAGDYSIGNNWSETH